MTSLMQPRSPDAAATFAGDAGPTVLPSTETRSESTHDGYTEEAALEQTAGVIAKDYPWASSEHVGEVLRSRFARTRDAKVQNYRLLLAERDTRTQLRREQHESLAPSRREAER